MCGILGSYNFSDEKVLRSMLKTIKHRGPDDSDYFLNSKCMLGINRLAILDPKLGKQPMASDDLIIVFNGEIFNYLELKKDLIKKGVKFFTRNSDTEVILQGYKIYGVDFLKKLNGMFAIAIYNKKKQELLLSRDRSGIKPLFYTSLGKKFFFSSEIKSLFDIPFFKKKPNSNSLYNYFGLKNIPSPETSFDQIYQLRPGQSILINNSKLKIFNFWKLKKKQTELKNNINSKILNTLNQAVKKQMRSDVEVGCFLSGGLDSSAIATLATKYTKKKLKTFSIIYENKIKSKNLDNILSKKMSKIIKSDHYEFKITHQNLNDEIDKALDCFDQPFAGTITSYFLSKMASKYVKVSLSGDGADELFGSYIFPRVCEAKQIWSNHKKKAKFLKYSSDVQNGFIDFEAINKKKIFHIKDYLMTINENEKNNLFSENFKRNKKKNTYYFKKIYNQYCESTDLINDALKIDFTTLLPDQVLSFVDILSMKSSLEIRPPFLDNDMIDLAFRINGSKKIINSDPKIILKKALKPILPSEILYRKKEGFVLPIEEMYLKQNEKKIRNVLSKHNLNKHGYINYDKFNNLLNNIQQNNFYQNNKIWIIYCFQNWWNKHF